MASIGSNSTFGKNRFKGKVHPFQTFTAVAVQSGHCRRISYLYKSLCHHAAHLSLSSWTKKYTHMSSSQASIAKQTQKPLPIYAMGGHTQSQLSAVKNAEI